LPAFEQQSSLKSGLIKNSATGIEEMGDVKKLTITEMRKRKFANQIGMDISADGDGVVAEGFFERYSDNQSYEDGFEDAFSGKYIVDLIKAVWGPELPYKLLDCGSANGLTLQQFDEHGVEAWGIENSAFIHSKTPEEWRERNLLGDVCHMPFEDEAFDFLYVTCLPHLPEEKIGQAMKEMFRVCRTGVVLQGVTTDMTEEVIEDYELFAGLLTFWTFPEWSDAMLRAGFQLAVSDPALLDEVWRIEQETDEDDWDWYQDKETMRYSFFNKPKAARDL
jgi:SAM-dependent methyltransferase